MKGLLYLVPDDWRGSLARAGLATLELRLFQQQVSFLPVKVTTHKEHLETVASLIGWPKPARRKKNRKEVEGNLSQRPG